MREREKNLKDSPFAFSLLFSSSFQFSIFPFSLDDGRRAPQAEETRKRKRERRRHLNFFSKVFNPLLPLLLLSFPFQRLCQPKGQTGPVMMVQRFGGGKIAIQSECEFFFSIFLAMFLWRNSFASLFAFLNWRFSYQPGGWRKLKLDQAWRDKGERGRRIFFFPMACGNR